MSRDEIILEALRQARPMLLRIAARYEIDFDDLYQESAMLVTEIVHTRLPATNNPYRYLQTAMRLNAYDVIRALRHNMKSLDKPFDDGSDLADTLEIPAIELVDEKREDRRRAALYRALRRLYLEEQQYMREVHKLYGFDPLPPDWTRKPDYTRSRSVMSNRVMRCLRRDKELASAILEV